MSMLTEWLNCASVEMTLLFSLIFGMAGSFPRM